MSEANLGCATTRQLLEELQARGQFELRYQRFGDTMASQVGHLLESLPETMLDYRTVDDQRRS